jgi:hypothetical protein
MPYSGYQKTGEANPNAPTAADNALSAAAKAGGTNYLTQLYNNSQSVNNEGVKSYNAQGQPTSATAAIYGSSAAGIAGSSLTMEQLLSEVGLTDPTAQNAAIYLADQYNQNLTGAALTAGQNTLQQQGNAAQLNMTNLQQAYEQAQYGGQMTQYPEQQAEAALQNQNAMQQLSSSGAIGGTLNTQGQKQAVSTQQQQYGWQQEDIARAQQNAELGQGSEVAGYQYSAGDIARSEQNLQLAAAANGLSVQQLQSQFAQGASALGLSSDNLEQLYTQYLNQQTSQTGALGSAEGTAGVLIPGSTLLNAGMQGGVNLSSIMSTGT